jgi:pimeloyl-ACP methyl ester carboxylesterase
MFADPRNIDDLAIEIQARNVRAARFKSRIFAQTRDIPMLLPHVPCPVGAIWGGADNILVASNTPVAHVFDILCRAKPDLLTSVIDDAGHWAAYEASVVFVAALEPMLQRLEGLTPSGGTG